MGIVNLTPDSFSGDGIYQPSFVGCQMPSAIDYVKKMVDDGADIIDIGAESSRPGSPPISIKEELKRLIPVIKILVKKIKVPISVDTCKPEVARQVLDMGAAIINDISGLSNPQMRKIISKYKAGIIIMHMQGNPRTMQKNPTYLSLFDEIIDYFQRAIASAVAAGVNAEKIIIDPGLGFGKTLQHNLEILKRLREFKVLGRPILTGPSRKSFIGKILHNQPQERIYGTIASCVLAARNGANIVRVHDVKAVKEALLVSDSIINS